MASAMNKQSLVEAVRQETGSTVKEATASVDAVFGAISKGLAKGEGLRLVGFGTFKVQERAPRKGRNPQSGEEIQIEARKVVTFKAGASLKDAVNGK